MNTVSPTKPFANAVDARIIEIDSQRSYDVGRRILILPEGQVKLTPTLGNVYRALLGNPGYALSNRQIIDEAYGKGYHIQEKAAQNRVNDFRRQVKHHTSWDAIKYIDGIGYMANMDFDAPQPSERIDIDRDGAYLDLRNYHVIRSNSDPVILLSAEFKIYKILLDHPGYLLSNRDILDIYEKDRFEDDNYEPINENNVQVNVSKIREKLQVNEWNPIINIYGGYMANIDFDDPKPDERVDLADDAYFDKRNGRVYREGYEYEQLATAQRAIFQYLLENPEHTFSRAKLMESVAKDFNKVAKPDTADVHITHIRAALKRLDLPATDIIETVRGQGYRFNSKARTLW
jgi:DNA-binding response OmpR family regulator